MKSTHFSVLSQNAAFLHILWAAQEERNKNYKKWLCYTLDSQK